MGGVGTKPSNWGIKKMNKMTTKELNEKFDNDIDVLEHFDISSAKRQGLDIKRVKVDFPNWMVNSIDKEAGRIGVTRQSLIKLWLADKLNHLTTV